MKYYSIRESLDKKNVGTYPQVIHARHNCHVWDEPKFIDKFYFTKIDFEPITSNAILEKKAKLTDLISSNGIGFTLKLLISGKLKKILERYSGKKYQFFQAPVIFKNELINDYWLVNSYNFNLEFIDYDKSSINVSIRKKEGGTEPKSVIASNLDKFMKIVNYHKERNEIVTITKVVLKKHIKCDFFALRYVGGGLFTVSEKLKKEIEGAGCTGIEFMPIELTLNEWLHSEREKVYEKS
ncbi:imm11 family protein [Leeuwenhoekiella marinoflava]|uniref:imm11 family protein n=1 Tax=Leeuwenhoekiella marinoflava TaxID=988 RepID=UPI0030038793